MWRLIRGWNLFLVFAAVWIGGAVGASDFNPWWAVVGGFSAFCLGAFGNAVNDIYDRDVDRRRKRDRPIPSGQLTLRDAALYSLVFGLLAFLSGLLLGVYVFVVVCLTLFLLWLYSRRLKGWNGAGHLMVALFSGMVFVFGALVQGETPLSIMPHGWCAAALAFLWHLAREWVKTAEDQEDDRALGIRTLAVQWGTEKLCRMAAAALGVLVLLLWVPFALGWFSLTYLLIAMVAVAPVLAATAYYLWSVPDRDRLGQLALVLKWTMPIGMAAIWLG